MPQLPYPRLFYIHGLNLFPTRSGFIYLYPYLEEKVFFRLSTGLIATYSASRIAVII